MFCNKQTNPDLEVLNNLYGLPDSGRGRWWVKSPQRCCDELARLVLNTNAIVYHNGNRLIIEETIVNDFGTRFTIQIVTKNYPFKMPKVFLKSSQITINKTIHRYKDESLCLVHPSNYSTTMTILKFRNMAATWCFCIEAYMQTGKWPGAEYKH